MSSFINKLSSIGVRETDSSEEKYQKNFLLYLAIFMSFGGVTWGTITLTNGLVVASLSPYGYVLVSIINLLAFSQHKTLRIARSVQILISLLLPFIFQWTLGGYGPSGAIMLWSVLALYASFTFKNSNESFIWLVLFLALSIGSAIFDEEISSMKSPLLPDFSLLFLVINIAMICSIIFGLTLMIVNRQQAIQDELNKTLVRVKRQEEQVRKNAEKQLEVNEKLYLLQKGMKIKNLRYAKSEAELKIITQKQQAINKHLFNAQKELKAQEFKLRAVLENAPFIIFTTDNEANITLFEGSVLTKLGYSTGEFVGTSAMEVYKDSPEIIEGIQEGLLGMFHRFEASFGGYMFETTCIPLMDEEGKQNGLLAVSADITEQKLAAEKVNKALERAKKSEDKMRQVAEDQLEATEKLMMAEKQLKEAFEHELESKKQLQNTQAQLVNNEKMASLGQLTAGIAHEINNPINFVYNGIDTLKMTLDELVTIVEKVNDYKKDKDKDKFISEIEELQEEFDVEELTEDILELVSDIKKGAVRTMEIVKGLRIFSRLDEEEQKPANINENLDATLVLLTNKTKNRVEVKKYYDEKLDPINCYPGQLNQVFMNLLNNAVQAIPEEQKGSIMIYTENRDDEIIIRIKDDGTGMPEEVRKRIFEPFYTTKPVGIGTGLGLSISYGIIEKHKGQIYVNSELGKGTEFVIHLPKHS
ncbi:MAG: ATP-binding protein [Cyclobacteriaceae bacterium]|nr:ATP-binding protein [Cyclobacteriaceae bacterium]